MAAGEEHVYHPKDTFAATLQGTAVTGGAGLLFSAVQNTLTRQNVNAWGVFSKFGATTATFAASGGAYEFVKVASANLREKDDAYNSAIGGFFAGSVIGLRYGSVPAVLGYGAMTACFLGVYDLGGGALTGYKKGKEMDEFEYKQYLRKNRRRPIQETIDEIGEGRGVYAPGYPERRAARIKATYGIDVPTTK